VGLTEGVHYLPRRERTFRKINYFPGHIAIAPNRDLWGVGANGLSMVARPNGVAEERRMLASTLGVSLHFDRNGGLWVADVKRGMMFLADPAKALATGDFSMLEATGDALGTIEGLSSQAVRAITEDREGNIWISTQNGLDRFRRSRMSPMPFEAADGEQWRVALAGREGAIWAGDWANGLYEVRPGAPRGRCPMRRSPSAPWPWTHVAPCGWGRQRGMSTARRTGH
jgi:hypothetical protein